MKKKKENEGGFLLGSSLSFLLAPIIFFSFPVRLRHQINVFLNNTEVCTYLPKTFTCMSQSQFCKFRCENIKGDRIWKEILMGISQVRL